jgi:ABC-type lipoprotein release transport system permease subunit
VLLGETFTVQRVLPQNGNIDDISILMNLADVQRLTGQEQKIGGVLALSCNCAAGDLAPIRAEVARVLAGVQVIEFTVRARARQRARETIARRTREEMADIEAGRGALRRQLARLATVLVAAVTTGCVVLLVVVTVGSVRERRTEVAMLRALGLGADRILLLFLGKAALGGVSGSVAGALIGVAIAGGLAGPGAAVSAAFLSGVIVVTAGVALLAAAVPAWRAAATDPAVILNQE